MLTDSELYSYIFTLPEKVYSRIHLSLCPVSSCEFGLELTTASIVTKDAGDETMVGIKATNDNEITIVSRGSDLKRV